MLRNEKQNLKQQEWKVLVVTSEKLSNKKKPISKTKKENANHFKSH